MANISTLLNTIKTAVYGKDMRSALHNAIKAVNDDINNSVKPSMSATQGVAADTLSKTTSLGVRVDELTTYSTTPQRIGTWIDGTPVWRMIFKGTLTASQKQDKSVSAGIPVKDYNKVFIINAWGQLYSGEPCYVDDNILEYEFGDAFSMANISEAAIRVKDGYYGWFDFVTAESNLK